MKRSSSPSGKLDGSPPRKIRRAFTAEEFTTALKTNNLPAVQAVLSANPTLLETILEFQPPRQQHEIGGTPLVVAAAFGCLEVAKFLVESKADVHAENDEALHWSARGGQLEVVKFLVENGADVRAENDKALCWSALTGRLEVVKFLAKNGAVVRAFDNRALRWSAMHGRLEVVKFLAENGADVYAFNDEALRWSAFNGHLEVVKFLVENKADVHALDDAALRWSAMNGRLEVVKFLMDNGADVHAQNNEALCLSAENGHPAVVGFLLQHYTEAEIQNLPINAVQQVCQQHARKEYASVQNVWSDIAELVKGSANLTNQSVLDSSSPLPLVILQAVVLRECEITLTFFQ